MINKNSIVSVNSSTFSVNFIKPLYESYCFSNISKTIKNIFTGEKEKALPNDVFGNLEKKYDQVILFFIDSFGWHFFEKYADSYPVLKMFIKNGVISKLTSQFPSTTSAHTTSIHTGFDVGQSGVYEWFYYEPKVDAIIAPLLFSFADKKERDSLKSTSISPKEIYPITTFYQTLKQHGIKSYIFQHYEYTPSTYSDIVFQGAKIYPYKTLPEAFTNLTDLITNQKEKAYYFLYFDKIDSIGHEYGPSSSQFDAEVDSFLTCLERIFIKNLHRCPKNTLLMITADHGQTTVNPKTTIYLNLDFPEIKNWIRVNKQGKLLVPAGSCRDMFLYIKDNYLDEAQKFLSQKLKGKAEVYKIPYLIENGLFNQPSKIFLERVGNLVILPYKNESVWWYEKDKFEQRHYGHHGGLTKEEMEIGLFLFSF